MGSTIAAAFFACVGLFCATTQEKNNYGPPGDPLWNSQNALYRPNLMHRYTAGPTAISPGEMVWAWGQSETNCLMHLQGGKNASSLSTGDLGRLNRPDRRD
ncbi:MAG: hypothetical protein NVSMB32_18950 [Actinomycetota bacterium]